MLVCVSPAEAPETLHASTCHHFQPDSQSKWGQTVTMETSCHINSIYVVFKAVIFITMKVRTTLSWPILMETTLSRNASRFNE
jgi:hypothetical protein